MYKTSKLMALISLGLIVVLASSCATILNDNPQRVVIKATPAEADIYVDGQNVGKGSVEQFLSTERDHLIKAKLGDDEKEVTIKSNIGILWVIADVFLTGLIGVVIDAITDEWKELHVPESGEILINLK